MAPEVQKSDLVCAFHGDLEGYMARIERKVDRIEKSVGDLSGEIIGLKLWKAKVIGYAAGVSAAVALAAKFILR